MVGQGLALYTLVTSADPHCYHYRTGVIPRCYHWCGDDLREYGLSEHLSNDNYLLQPNADSGLHLPL